MPCIWQSRIQAGDLASHVYNTWFARFIQAHHPAGLAVVRQSTNVLFDELLSALLPLCGVAWAERWAVGICVLVFLWGAFRFISRFDGACGWRVMPFLLLFAWGWTLQMGLLNFYLSLGLSFWALSFALEFRAGPLIAAAVLAAVAWRAHNLPVLWMAGALVWALAARHLSQRRLLRLGVAIAMAVATLSVLLRLRFPTQWSVEQLSSMTGADQAWVFDAKYYVVFAGILFYWVTLVTRRALRSLPVQLAILTAFSIGVLPTGVLLPGYSHGLVYIAERMSLAIAICLLAWFATVPITLSRAGAAVALTALFFAMIYHDWAALNHLEDQVERAVATVPRNAPVIFGVESKGSRIAVGTHMVDRACIGWCFSYANYEASTAQFRVRVLAQNPFVASDYRKSYAMQSGTYTAELPLYEIVIGPTGARAVQLTLGHRQTLSRITPF